MSVCVFVYVRPVPNSDPIASRHTRALWTSATYQRHSRSQVCASRGKAPSPPQRERDTRKNARGASGRQIQLWYVVCDGGKKTTSGVIASEKGGRVNGHGHTTDRQTDRQTRLENISRGCTVVRISLFIPPSDRHTDRQGGDDDGMVVREMCDVCLCAGRQVGRQAGR